MLCCAVLCCAGLGVTRLPAESVFGCVGSVERGVAKVLGGDPKGATFTYTNGNTVVIRDIAVRSQ